MLHTEPLRHLPKLYLFECFRMQFSRDVNKTFQMFILRFKSTISSGKGVKAWRYNTDLSLSEPPGKYSRIRNYFWHIASLRRFAGRYSNSSKGAFPIRCVLILHWKSSTAEKSQKKGNLVPKFEKFALTIWLRWWLMVRIMTKQR